MVTVETPEILQIINNAIINLVTFIETYGMIVFYLMLILFVVWLVWNIGWFVNEIIKNG